MSASGAGQSDQPNRLTMHEVAQLKGVSYQTVWRAVSRGQLRAQREGRSVRITAEDAEAWTPFYSRAPQRYREQTTPRKRQPPRRRALIVEDDQVIRKMLEEIVKGEGFTVVGVAEGDAAINAVKRSPFSHIFVDLRLPGKRGSEIIPVLRTFAPHAVIAVVTAYESDLAEIDQTTTGPIVVIEKPFNIARIIAVLSSSGPP